MTDTTTPLDEKQIALLLRDLNDLLTKDGLRTLPEKLKALEGKVEGVVSSAVDVKKLSDEIEKLRVAQEQCINMVRRNAKRAPWHVPGVEDEQFSLSMALFAIRTRNWSGAEKEKEILEAVRKRRAEIMTRAGQTVSTGALASYFIPDEVIADVIGALYAQSAFIALDGEGQTRVSVLDGLVGSPVRIPKFNGGCVAYWMGAEDQYAASAVDVGDVTFNQHKIGVLVRLNDAVRRFGSFGFEGLLRRDMQKALALKVDWTIPYGTGLDEMPRGICSTNGVRVFSAESGKGGVLGTDGLGAAPFQADWAGAELTFDVLDEMMGVFEDNNVVLPASAAPISHPRTFRHLRQLKVLNYAAQATGNPYLLGMPMITDARLREAIGPYIKSTQIRSTQKPGQSVGAPTTSVVAKHADVFHGDMGEVLFARWSGVEVEDDGGTSEFIKDNLLIKMRMYASVAVRDGRAVMVCPDAKVRA